MNPKKLIVLLVLVAVLAAAAWVKRSGVERRETVQDAAALAAVQVLPAAVNPSFVTRIRIRDGAGPDEVALAKGAAGDWTLVNYFGAPAAKMSVEAFVKSISELKGELRADSKEVLDDFKIGEDSALRILLEDAAGSAVGTVFVSRRRATGAQNFVRPGGTDRVFVTRTDLLSELGIYSPEDPLDRKLFLDLQVARIDFTQITSFSVRPKKGGAITLIKHAKTEDKPVRWEFEPADGSLIDTAQANAFLAKVVNLFATDAVDASAQDWGDPWITVNYLRDGKPAQTQLFLGAFTESSKSFAVKSEPLGVVFTVPEASVDPLRPEKASFVQKTP